VKLNRVMENGYLCSQHVYLTILSDLLQLTSLCEIRM